MGAVRRVGVVVPAHNERELLPGCLTALGTAAAGLDVRVVVVLDRCIDGTEGVCREWPVETVRIGAGNVGRARAAGVAHLLGSTDPSGLWLAHTDADTQVSSTWIRDQLDLAAGGADVVLGVVRLLGAGRRRYARHQAAYRAGVRSDGTHEHVHGANLGLAADAYLQAGGFPPLAAHEDLHLVRRLEALDHLNLVRTSRLWVKTSPRRAGRCIEGFAADLADSLSA